MAFKIYNPSSEFIDLPFPEKTYRAVSPPREVGILMTRITAAQLKVARGGELDEDEQDLLRSAADDVSGAEFERLLLGDALYDELVADKVTSARWNLIVNTLALWASTNDLSEVEAFWNSGGQSRGKAPKKPSDRKRKKN